MGDVTYIGPASFLRTSGLEITSKAVAVRQEPTDQRASRARLLATVGALVAGVGAGLVVPRMAQPIGASVLVVGALAHAIGMFGARRAERDAGYLPAAWEVMAYWVCWLLIVVAIAAVAWALA